ncbi:MAG TPA: DUF3466 family protein [Phycisphaerales bacterium]|nr:DUF3466 family protein [Phycisphaerales bacterium]
MPASWPCPSFQGGSRDISDHGIIAGNGNCGLGVGGAFIWNPKTDNAVHFITHPPGITGMSVTGVSDSGVVVGYMNGPSINATHAFKYVNEVVIDLGVLPGGIQSAAMAINNDGTIVGYGDSPTGIHACVWRDDKLSAIEIPRSVPYSDTAIAYGINNNGVVVGDVGTIPHGEAFIFDHEKLTIISSTPETVDAHARRINDNGIVIMRGTVTHDGQPPYSTRGFLWHNGQFMSAEDIAACGETTTDSIFIGLNSMGDTLAYASPCPAVILQHCQPFHVYDLINYDVSNLLGFNDINDQGILIGSVVIDNQGEVPAIFVPVPPIPGDFTCDNQVNIDDLTEVILQWGEPNMVIDVDHSGAVDAPDLLQVLNNWTSTR